MNSKTCLFAVLLFCIVMPQIQAMRNLKEFMKIHNDCAKESHVDIDVLERHLDSPEPEGDPKVKDYVFCAYKRLGMINSAGVIQTDACKRELALADPNVPEDRLAKIVDKCAVQKSTPPETVYQFIKCFHNEEENLEENVTATRE